MGVRPYLLATVVVVAGMAVASAISGAQSDEEPISQEMKRLQGEWTMVSLDVNGLKGGERETRDWVLVVERDEYNPGMGENSVEYLFRIDPTRTPKAIDLIPAEGPHRGRTYRAVYELDGDMFTVNRPLDPDNDRPAGFTSRRNSGLVRVVWKRRKSVN